MDSNDNKYASIVKHVCSSLFIAFSFLYLYFIQGEYIAKLQFILSDGRTIYSIFWGALIITLLLKIIQLLTQRIFITSLHFYALTYIPSFMFLVVLCDIFVSTTQHINLGWWWLGIPLTLFFTYLLNKWSYDIRKHLFSHNTQHKLLSFLLSNFLVFFILFLLSGSINSTSDTELYEMKVERLIKMGKYNEALHVGKKSLSSNRRLTNLRMYALSRLRQLPDKLYDYPQYYGKEGLLCLYDIDQSNYRVDVRDICSYLGIYNLKNITSTEQLFNEAINRQQIIFDSLMSIELYKSNNPDSLKIEVEKRYKYIKEMKRRIDEYTLCSLLLERDLELFKNKINNVYNFNIRDDSIVKTETLPKSYREALVMIYPDLEDTLMLKQYNEYLELKASEKDSVAWSNKTRRKYGNTFWWYYDNPQITIKRFIKNL